MVSSFTLHILHLDKMLVLSIAFWMWIILRAWSCLVIVVSSFLLLISPTVVIAKFHYRTLLFVL